MAAEARGAEEEGRVAGAPGAGGREERPREGEDGLGVVVGDCQADSREGFGWGAVRCHYRGGVSGGC